MGDLSGPWDIHGSYSEVHQRSNSREAERDELEGLRREATARGKGRGGDPKPEAAAQHFGRRRRKAEEGPKQEEGEEEAEEGPQQGDQHQDGGGPICNYRPRSQRGGPTQTSKEGKEARKAQQKQEGEFKVIDVERDIRHIRDGGGGGSARGILLASDCHSKNIAALPWGADSNYGIRSSAEDDAWSFTPGGREGGSEAYYTTVLPPAAVSEHEVAGRLGYQRPWA